MKRYKNLIIPVTILSLFVGLVWLILQTTAYYPTCGEPVAYTVNQVDDFNLLLEEPTWSPFRGYTIRYSIEIDSENIYYLTKEDSKTFVYIEKLIDGLWYRMDYQKETADDIHRSFEIGGYDNTGFESSIVQRYEGYGTRLESGIYRLTLELTDQHGNSYYLASEFDVN